MYVKVRIRRRPDYSKNVQTFHRELMEALYGVDFLWNSRVNPDAALELDGADGAADLTPLLRDGIQGAVHYGPRYSNYVEDKAMFDDTLILELDTDRIDYGAFVNSVFPALLFAMKAYRGLVVLHKELDRDDLDAIVDLCEKTGKDENGRDGIFRLSSVTYADRELCRRAFRLSPEEIVKRASEVTESARFFMDGALIIYTSEVLGRSEFAKVDATLREVLK